MVGVRKLTFNTPIVTTTENVTSIMVKRRYLPRIEKQFSGNILAGYQGSKEDPLASIEKLHHHLILPNKGTDMEVGGIISANSKKNTVNESRIEMDKDTCVTKETVH